MASAAARRGRRAALAVARASQPEAASLSLRPRAARGVAAGSTPLRLV